MAPATRERDATAKSGPFFRGYVPLVAHVAGKALDTLMGVLRRARRLFVKLGAVVSLFGLVRAACTVNPPPAPQSTDTPHSSGPPPQRPTQIIMGIDSIGAGFNPHLLSDLSPVNAAVSALVLPSAFRPVHDPDAPTGSRWEMDPTLLVSAEVTSQNPFTVTYKIRPEAQWTDNAPIESMPTMIWVTRCGGAGGLCGVSVLCGAGGGLTVHAANVSPASETSTPIVRKTRRACLGTFIRVSSSCPATRLTTRG